MTDTVTSGRFTNGAVDEKKYAEFCAKTLRWYKRQVVKGAKDMRSMYFGWTDQDCQDAADAYCRAYEHQFRVLVPVT